MTIYTISGWFGTFLLLFSYTLFVRGHPLARGIRYLVLNIIGTLFLLPNMVHQEIWSMVIFQLIWIGISLQGICDALYPE